MVCSKTSLVPATFINNICYHVKINSSEYLGNLEEVEFPVSESRHCDFDKEHNTVMETCNQLVRTSSDSVETNPVRSFISDSPSPSDTKEKSSLKRDMPHIPSQL